MKLKKAVNVRIFNLSEDVWPFIQSMSSKADRLNEIEENANLADRDLYSMAEEFEFVFITAKPVDPDFVEYFKKLCLVRELEIIIPKNHTGKLCEDLQNDKKTWKRLIEIGKSAQKLILTSYSTTPEFLSLVKNIKKQGIDVRTPLAPNEANSWTVNFYGSKSGIRQVTQINGAIRADLKMPRGVVCSGILDTAKVAANKYIKEKGVVIKTNKGHSGAGILIFHKGELPDTYEKCLAEIIKVFKKDKYWGKFPIVVESLIKPNFKIGGGFPNAEFMVRKNGDVHLLYFCGMRVDKNGVFGGVEISEKVLPKRIASRVVDIGYLIGEQYAEDGYVGYFDIDFIATKSKEVLVNESNVRVTGGTHVYQAAIELAGRSFTKNTYVLSDNMYSIPSEKKYKFTEIEKLFKKLLFDRKKREGVVIASANLLSQGKLAYIIFGKNKKRAVEIEGEMKKLLTD